MALIVEIDERRAPAKRGRSLFECAEALGVVVPTSCRKKGRCRECLVEVERGGDLLSPASPEEAHLTGTFRLACRARLVGPSGYVRCRTLRRSGLRIEEEGTVAEGRLELDPAVRRDGRFVLVDDEPVAPATGPPAGVAVDLGTTTVVVRLYDLETGRLLGAASFENPQRFGGSDVLARIQYDTEHPDRLLRRTLLGYLGRAIAGLGVPPERIFELVVAGNTTMRDLFFGLDVRPIGQKPYRSVTEHELLAGARATTALVEPARRFPLPLHPKGRVYGLPLVGSHVGADAAASILAAGIGETDAVRILVDIGTNTEIVVGNRERLLAASCPAGPAFEGGRLGCGMPAFEGAIERVALDEDGRVRYRVIGGGRPSGVCGSGLVDVLSELRRTGLMNAQGRLAGEDGRFVLDAARCIVLTEADINELAQAKGANVAGLRLLLARYGVRADDVERLYLAGGFARHLDLGAARRIGLLPDWPDEKFERIGNAAIEGAAMALLSRPARRRLEERVRRIEHVELETEPAFFDAFVEGCQFEPFRTELD